MVGFPGEPGSNAEVSSTGREEVDRDYFIGTVSSPEKIEEVFDQSKYFAGDGDSYRAAGIEADLTPEGIEYDVDRGVDDKVKTEFVDGVIRSFDDVDEKFRNEVDNEIYGQSKEIVADGGFEYQRFFDSMTDGEINGEVDGYESVSIEEYDQGIAVRGTHSEVREFVSEFRQAFGAEKPEQHFDMRSSKAITDGGTNQQTMSDVGHQNPSGENVQEMMERGHEDEMVTDGGVNSVPGTSFGDYSEESPESENFMGDMPV